MQLLGLCALMKFLPCKCVFVRVSSRVTDAGHIFPAHAACSSTSSLPRALSSHSSQHLKPAGGACCQLHVVFPSHYAQAPPCVLSGDRIDGSHRPPIHVCTHLACIVHIVHIVHTWLSLIQSFLDTVELPAFLGLQQLNWLIPAHRLSTIPVYIWLQCQSL